SALFILHRKADAMEHEPSRFLSDANSTGQFITTNAVLGISNQPHRDQPLIEADGTIFHDGADLDGELPFGMLFLAFPDAASLDEQHISATASGTTNRTNAPTEFHHFRHASVGVGEVLNSLLEGFGRTVSN